MKGRAELGTFAHLRRFCDGPKKMGDWGGWVKFVTSFVERGGPFPPQVYCGLPLCAEEHLRMQSYRGESMVETPGEGEGGRLPPAAKVYRAKV